MTALVNSIGGKATQLRTLQAHGYPVPAFVVIAAEEVSLLTQKELSQRINGLHGEYFAVRSSANLEDGVQHSFAGLLETRLYVPREQVLAAIKEVASAGNRERVQTYLHTHGLAATALQVAIIVQEMIAATVSGVGFSKNPLRPHLHECVINAVYGLGEGLVSGTLEADTYTRTQKDTWVSVVADKQQELAYSPSEGLHYRQVTNEKAQLPALTPVQLEAIATLLYQLETLMGSPQDIEFCYADDQFYLLQSRPITTLRNYTEHIIWDNSNIIESYPGITSPFTFSFILGIYASVYYNFGKLLGVSDRQLAANSEVFDTMLGQLQGRVYYHLIHWYKALAMLPAYRLNASYMEKMMGVTEPLGIPIVLKAEPTKLQALGQLGKTIFRLLRLNAQLPSIKIAFVKKVKNILATYRQQDYTQRSAAEIWEDYTAFKRILVNEWSPPLANDLFAMIYFGTLEKWCREWLHAPQLHAELVIGKYPLVSVEPAKLVTRIVATAQSEGRLHELRQQPAAVVYEYCKNGTFGHTGQLIMEYLHAYGDRSIGELKLENDTYAQHPEAFIAVLQTYESLHTPMPPNIPAVREVARALPFYKRGIFRYVAHKAAETVADRENLRFYRTLAFGVVRRFLWHIGQHWTKAGILADAKDLFYMEEQEIAAFFNGQLTQADLQTRISTRRATYAQYATLPALPGRVHQLDGELLLDTPQPPAEGQLHGIPCCAGIVKAKVRILSTPHELQSLQGDILVTTSTDPGWITIFQSASGILVERGSTLSHAAIVCRELGIPCIVGVKGITRQLQDGDWIQMNGKTGIIEKL